MLEAATSKRMFKDNEENTYVNLFDPDALGYTNYMVHDLSYMNNLKRVDPTKVGDWRTCVKVFGDENQKSARGENQGLSLKDENQGLSLKCENQGLSLKDENQGLSLKCENQGLNLDDIKPSEADAFNLIILNKDGKINMSTNLNHVSDMNYAINGVGVTIKTVRGKHSVTVTLPADSTTIAQNYFNLKFADLVASDPIDRVLKSVKDVDALFLQNGTLWTFEQKKHIRNILVENLASALPGWIVTYREIISILNKN
jgi:hypothetical protein